MSSILKRIVNTATNSHRKYSLPWGDPTTSSNSSSNTSASNKSNNPVAAARLATENNRLSVELPAMSTPTDETAAGLITLDIVVLLSAKSKLSSSAQQQQQEEELSIEVPADTAIFDLSIGLCGRLKLSPGDHALVDYSSGDGQPSNFKELPPNQTAGQLISNKLALVKKSELKSNLIVKKEKAIVKTKDQIENRVLVHLPKGLKVVIRLKPTSTIQNALDTICQERGYPPDEYIIKHPKTGEVLDCKKTLAQYGTKELCFQRVDDKDPGWESSSLMTTSCHSVLPSTRTSSIPAPNQHRQRNTSAVSSVPLNRKMFTDWNTVSMPHHAASNSNLDFVPDSQRPDWDSTDYSGSTLPLRGSNADKRKSGGKSGGGKSVRRDKSVGDSAAQGFMSLFRRNKKKKDSIPQQSDTDDFSIASSLEEHLSRGGHTSQFAPGSLPPGDVISGSGIHRFNPIYEPDNSPSHQSPNQAAIISSSARPVSMVVAPGSLSRGSAGGLVCMQPPQAPPGSVASLPRRKKKGAAPQPPTSYCDDRDSNIYDELNNTDDNASTAMNSRASSQLWDNSSASVTPTCVHPATSQLSLSRSLASLLNNGPAVNAASVDTGINSSPCEEESPPIPAPYSTSSLKHPPTMSKSRKQQAPLPPPNLSKSSSELANYQTTAAVLSREIVQPLAPPLSMLTIPPPPSTAPPSHISPSIPPHTRDQCVGVSSGELSPLQSSPPQTIASSSDETKLEQNDERGGEEIKEVVDKSDNDDDDGEKDDDAITSEYCLQLMLHSFGETEEPVCEEKKETVAPEECKDDTSEESVELTHWHTREHTVQRVLKSDGEVNELGSSSGSTKSKTSTIKENEDDLIFRMSSTESQEPTYMILNDCLTDNLPDEDNFQSANDNNDRTESPAVSDSSSSKSGDFLREVLASCPQQISDDDALLPAQKSMTKSWCPLTSSSSSINDRAPLRKTVHEDTFQHNRRSEFKVEPHNNNDIDFILERRHVAKSVFDSRLIKKQTSAIPPPTKMKPALPKRISSIATSNSASSSPAGHLFFPAKLSDCGVVTDDQKSTLEDTSSIEVPPTNNEDYDDILTAVQSVGSSLDY